MRIGTGIRIDTQGNALPPIPGEVPGQTLVARELFETNISAGSPGNLTNVNGSLLGGQTNAPTVLNSSGQRTSVSGAIHRPTRAEYLAGTAGFAGTLAVPPGLARTCGNWRILLRVSENDYNDDYMLQSQGLFDGAWGNMKMKKNANGTITLKGEVNYQGVQTPVDVWPDEWFEIFLAWEFTHATNQCRTSMYAKTGANETPILMNTRTITYAAEEMRSFRFGLAPSANRWSTSGRIACMEIRSATSWAVANERPGGLIWPTNERRTHNVASWEAFVAGLNNNTILTRYKNWAEGNTLRNYSTLTNNVEREDFNTKFWAGSLRHTGDCVVLPEGNTRITTTAVRGRPYLELKGHPNGSTVSLADEMAAGWTAMTSGGGVSVYRYAGADGHFGRRPWMLDGNDRYPFRNVVADGYTGSADTLLLAHPWTCWTDKTDNKTYMSVPTATNPASFAWEGSKLVPTELDQEGGSVDLTGSYTHGITFVGMCLHNYDVAGAATERVRQNGLFVTCGPRTITAIVGNILCEGGKHCLSLGGQVAHGMLIESNEFRNGPPRESGLYGTPMAAWCFVVDNVNDATTNPSNPGSYVSFKRPLPCPQAIAVPGSAAGVPFQGSEFTYLWHNLEDGSGWQGVLLHVDFQGVEISNYFYDDAPPTTTSTDVFQTVEVFGP